MQSEKKLTWKVDLCNFICKRSLLLGINLSCAIKSKSWPEPDVTLLLHTPIYVSPLWSFLLHLTGFDLTDLSLSSWTTVIIITTTTTTMAVSLHQQLHFPSFLCHVESIFMVSVFEAMTVSAGVVWMSVFLCCVTSCCHLCAHGHTCTPLAWWDTDSCWLHRTVIQ